MIGGDIGAGMVVAGESRRCPRSRTSGNADRAAVRSLNASRPCLGLGSAGAVNRRTIGEDSRALSEFRGHRSGNCNRFASRRAGAPRRTISSNGGRIVAADDRCGVGDGNVARGEVGNTLGKARGIGRPANNRAISSCDSTGVGFALAAAYTAAAKLKQCGARVRPRAPFRQRLDLVSAAPSGVAGNRHWSRAAIIDIAAAGDIAVVLAAYAVAVSVAVLVR